MDGRTEPLTRFLFAAMGLLIHTAEHEGLRRAITGWVVSDVTLAPMVAA